MFHLTDLPAEAVFYFIFMNWLAVNTLLKLANTDLTAAFFLQMKELIMGNAAHKATMLNIFLIVVYINEKTLDAFKKMCVPLLI